MSCGCNLRKRINIKNITLNKRDVYLDYNATTKPDLAVLAEVERVNRTLWGNPSAQNSRGVALYNYLTNQIDSLKKTFKLPNASIYIDSSSTSIAEKLIEKIGYKSIITTEIDHKSLSNKILNKLKVDNSGKLLETELVKSIIESKPSLLIYSPINHETGNIQNIKNIYALCKKNNISVIIDAVQTISKLNISDWIPYCDGFYYSGHKIHGLSGAAALILIDDTINMGTDESTLPFSLYSGTFNTSSSVALLKATTNLLNNFNETKNYIEVLHKDALSIFKQYNINYILESDPLSAPGIINISIPDIANMEDLFLHLNSEGIQISRFSACSGDINIESEVLKAMGREKYRTLSSLRITFGKDSIRDDFHRLSKAIISFNPIISN